jgi:hypothetical protein
MRASIAPAFLTSCADTICRHELREIRLRGSPPTSTDYSSEVADTIIGANHPLLRFRLYGNSTPGIFRTGFGVCACAARKARSVRKFPPR